MTTRKKSQPKNLEAYRATLYCGMGISVMEGTIKPPEGMSATDYAINCLLHAVEHTAKAIEGAGK
jgi:hypothetical protein